MSDLPEDLPSSQQRRAERKSREPIPRILELALAGVRQRQTDIELLLTGFQQNATRVHNELVELRELVAQTKQAVQTEHSAALKTFEEHATRIVEAIATQSSTGVEKAVEQLNQTIADLSRQLATESGAGSVGYSAETEYSENTVGRQIAELRAELRKHTSGLVNFGDMAVIPVIAKSGTISKSLTIFKCPDGVEAVDLDVIQGGVKNDMLLATASGIVNVKTTGNVRLKSNCQLTSGRYLLLLKNKDVWEELWRSH